MRDFPQFWIYSTDFCSTGQVVQKMDNAIHQINHFQVDSVVCFVNTYSLDNKLECCSAFEQLSNWLILLPKMECQSINFAIMLGKSKNKPCYLKLWKEMKTREDICLQTLLLLFKYANHKNKRSFVSTANEALVGTLMTIGDVNNTFPIALG